ncbi:MAG: MltA domain-containing protein [Rickettsiales bacterium]|nr:MltA domain-containing protein [Rickettsiales bacterium]
MFRRLGSLLCLITLSACSFFQQPDHFEAREITFSELNNWPSDNHSEALQSFLMSCPALSKTSRNATTGSNIAIPLPVWKSLCQDAVKSAIIPAEARQFFERRFVPFRISNNRKEHGLFTGYYEPVLYGSRHKGGDFIYPLYAAPAELKNSKPYFTRQEIDEGRLAGRRLELVWVDDPVMLFFMQIQGSGRVRLTNGSEIRLGYADQNGHGYVGIGKLFGEEGLLPKDQINFFTLRQWLYDHPNQAIAMMQRNPSYVFFKEYQGPGPIGSVGVALTPRRSLAVDNRYMPYGLPVYLETKLPAEPAREAVNFQRLMVTQDTGGAIRGPVRGDIFFGAGDEAEYMAGYMKGRGVYSLLVPREVADQLRP